METLGTYCVDEKQSIWCRILDCVVEESEFTDVSDGFSENNEEQGKLDKYVVGLSSKTLDCVVREEKSFRRGRKT